MLKLDRILSLVLNPHCLRCGSFFRDKHYLCSNCDKVFFAERVFHKVALKKVEPIKAEILGMSAIEINYFISWVPNESDTLSELIYQLKDITSEEAWVHIVQLYVYSYLKNNESLNKIEAILPIPGNKSSYHTQYFANALATVLNRPVVNAFTKTSSLESSQKNLNHRQRQQIQFSMTEEFTLNAAKLTNVLIVDDVVTTGGTFQSALCAITQNQTQIDKITLLSLFHRELCL